MKGSNTNAANPIDPGEPLTALGYGVFADGWPITLED